MNDLTLTITDLKAKVEKLVNLHQTLKKENEQLGSENGKLLKTIEEQKVTITTLETKNKELVNTNNEEQNKIITDTKSKINELVQEIDNCIVLLK